MINLAPELHRLAVWARQVAKTEAQNESKSGVEARKSVVRWLLPFQCKNKGGALYVIKEVAQQSSEHQTSFSILLSRKKMWYQTSEFQFQCNKKIKNLHKI